MNILPADQFLALPWPASLKDKVFDTLVGCEFAALSAKAVPRTTTELVLQGWPDVPTEWPADTYAVLLLSRPGSRLLSRPKVQRARPMSKTRRAMALMHTEGYGLREAAREVGIDAGGLSRAAQKYHKGHLCPTCRRKM